MLLHSQLAAKHLVMGLELPAWNSSVKCLQLPMPCEKPSEGSIPFLCFTYTDFLHS